MTSVKYFHKFKPIIGTLNFSTVEYISEANDKMNKYKEAIDTLNTLQSNAAYLKERSNMKMSSHEEYKRTILQMRKYLISSGVTSKKLNNLNVVHVAGTKGKGSTCAYCESVLRFHGYKTGFYSSPHLLEVKERIRINGQPISHAVFADTFWHIYNKLYQEYPDNLPAYFKFLTIMAFHIFLKEKVDVAIVEVGIGGEFDSTNILRNVPVIGITSLGIDHTNILGSSIEEIAWHKAGIFKQNSMAFTLPQRDDAMAILRQRSQERETSLKVVQPFVNIEDSGNSNPEVSNMNASLAVTLAYAWIKTTKGINVSLKEFTDCPETKSGLASCSWPGRYQIIYSNCVNYYLDGAHTPESMEICVKWFKTVTRTSTRSKVLIFNMTGERNAEKILSHLIECEFSKVFFVPNISGRNSSADNKIKDKSFQMKKCDTYRSIWIGLSQYSKFKLSESNIIAKYSVNDAVMEITHTPCDCLVTGSLHLMGAALDVLDPDLLQTQKNSKVPLKNFVLSS